MNAFNIENANDNTQSAENNHSSYFTCFKKCCECRGMNHEVTHDSLKVKKSLNESHKGDQGIMMNQLG